MALDTTTPISCTFAGQACEDPAPLREELTRARFPDQADLVGKCNSILLARGRNPSHGFVVLTKAAYDKIPNPQDCQHSLILAAEGTLVVKRLCVTKVTAIVPRFRTATEIESTGWVVLEIADARHYARQWSGLTKLFGAIEPSAHQLTEPVTYREACEGIWEEIRGVFSLGEEKPFDLEFHVSEKEETVSPEELRFLGISAWDSLWVVLDLAGWTLYLDTDGKPHVIEIGHEVDDDQLDLITDDATRSTILDAGNIFEGPLPEKVKVFSIKRDYQFDPPDTLTAGDHWRLNPTHEEVFKTEDLLREPDENPDDEEPGRLVLNSPIAKGTIASLWSTLQYRTSSGGDTTENNQLVQRHSEQAARRFVKFIDRSSDKEYEWFGLKFIPARVEQGRQIPLEPLRPSRYFAGVFYRAHGQFTTSGLNSGVCEAVLKGGRPQLALPWAGEEARAGLLSRDQFPHGREIYGMLRKPSSAEEELGVLPAGRFGTVDVLKGFVQSSESSDEASWTVAGSVQAVNGTGGPIRYGRRVYVKWNYQLGVSGRWVIVASHSGDADLADWTMRCLGAALEVESIQDPGRIVLDKKRMFKLVIPEGEDPNNPSEAGISWYSGPDCSVLASPPGEDPAPIVWTQCPTVVSLTAKCWIKFGDTVLGSQPASALPDHLQEQQETSHVTWLGPSRTDSVKLRLPPSPERSHQFLISGPTDTGESELDWIGPGLSGYMELKFPDDTPVILTFTDGLLTSSSYAVGPYAAVGLPPTLFGTEFDDCPCINFNPCVEPTPPPPSEEPEPAICAACLPGTGWRTNDEVEITIRGYRSRIEEWEQAINGRHTINTFPHLGPCSFVYVGEDFGIDLPFGRIAVRANINLTFMQNAAGEVSRLRFSLIDSLGSLGEVVWLTTIAIDAPFDCTESQIWTFPLIYLDDNNRPQNTTFQIEWHGVRR